MIVKFTSPEEFCQEIEKDANAKAIGRGIVRCTIRHATSRLSPMILHVDAIATYSVGGQIIKLDHYCGDIWQLNTDDDKKVFDKAKACLSSVEEKCKALDLQVRSGILEEGY